MMTWKLLRHLIPMYAPTNPSPYYARERFHPPFWHRFRQMGTRLPGIITAVVLVLYFLAGYPMGILLRAMVFYVVLRLLFLLPSLMYMIIPIATVLAPVIVREREAGTWEILRTTPTNTDQIIMEKAAGALSGLHDWFHYMAGMMIPAALIIGIIGLGMSMTIEWFSVKTPLQAALWLAFIILTGVMSALIFVADRAQQCTLMLVAALTASSSRRTMKNAIPTALIAVGGTWLLDVVIGWTILMLAAGPVEWPLELHAFILLLFSPAVVYLLELPLVMVLPAVILTLSLRESLVWLAWRWTVHQASTL